MARLTNSEPLTFPHTQGREPKFRTNFIKVTPDIAALPHAPAVYACAPAEGPTRERSVGAAQHYSAINENLGTSYVFRRR